MNFALKKIEAVDTSPLDAPGKPITGSLVASKKTATNNTAESKKIPSPQDAPLVKTNQSDKVSSDKKDKKYGAEKEKRVPPRMRRQQQAEAEKKAVEKNSAARTNAPQSSIKPEAAPVPAIVQQQSKSNGPFTGPELAGDAPILDKSSSKVRGYSAKSSELIENGALASLKVQTDLSSCMMCLLEKMHWRGQARHIAEALPHFVDEMDITSLRNVMATLHFESRPVELFMAEIDPRLMPCLFVPEDRDAVVLLGLDNNGIKLFDGGSGQEIVFDPKKIKGTAYFFNAIDIDEILPSRHKTGWFRAVLERFRSLFYQTLGITFVLNMLALATPLFVRAVYDKVIATGSLPTLAYFAIGVGIAILCDLVLRTIRTRILAFIGARLDNIVGLAIFHKILFLPPLYTERATIGAQVARIKDFETIRDFFTGPLALVLFELPFVVIFIITIAYMGGPVAFVPIIMMALYGILALIFTPLIRSSVGKTAKSAAAKQELVIEVLGGMRAVKYSGAESTWLDRYRKLSAKSSLNGFYTSQYSSVVQTLSQVLMVTAGVGTIVFGVFRILNGDMSIGGLVASMMLVWRVLGPLQTAFISMTRITQVRSSITQIDNLMKLKGEREQFTQVHPLQKMDGYVSFVRVSIRYSPEADPALVGVSFEAEPGEVICIVGGNGSGKSSVLKLLAGMYQPQAGSIRIDNMDIRQMDMIELRHAVAYVPQSIQFFYGTIAQNLRLGVPTASDAEMRWACDKAGVLEDIENLQQGSGKWQRSGFDVRIGDSGAGQMTTSVLQRLNLARGYLKRAPIMLFDEPGNGLDFESDQKFMAEIDAMRGDTTILIVTHRPSHLKLADKIVWLEYGNVRAAGPAEEVLPQMPKDFI